MNEISTIDPVQWERQVKLEEEMVALGVARFRTQVSKAQERRAETDTSYGQDLMRVAWEPTRALLEEWLADTHVKRRAIAAPYFRKVDLDLAAFLICKGVLDGVSRSMNLNRIAHLIGSLFHDEYRFAEFKKQNGGLFHSHHERH